MLIVLFANVPPGYDSPPGLSLGSSGLFRVFWPYPVLALNAGAFTALAGLVMVLLWAAYLAAAALCPRRPGPSAGRASQALSVVFGFALFCNLLLAVAMPPVLSSDLYHYILFGHLAAFAHLNPYTSTAFTVRSDPLLPFAANRDVTSPYGPTWTLLAVAFSLIAGHGPLLSAIVFKVAAALFNLANAVLVLFLSRQLTGGDGVRSALLYAWNPLILVETAGSGHNDAVMMTFALLGLLLVVRGRTSTGLPLIALSVFVKYLSGLLLFFAVVAVVARAESRREAATTVGRAGVATLVLLVAIFWPFWAGLRTFAATASVGAAFKTPVRLALREVVARWLLHGRDLAAARLAAEPYVIVGLHVAFALLVVFLTVDLWRKAQSSDPATTWIRATEKFGTASLVYSWIVYGWNFPWYLIAPLSTVFVAPETPTNNRLFAACTALGLVWMLLYAYLSPT